MRAIPIGGDPQDFSALVERPPKAQLHALDGNLVNISYVGAFLPRAGPLVRQIFRAARLLLARKPSLAARLRFNFVGTSNQPGEFAGTGPVTRIAFEEGVERFVRETPRRVPFLEALSTLAHSHALMMIGSDEPHYTASKIYPGLMSGRPFLSLYHVHSSSHAILSAAGGGACFAFSSLDELEGMAGPLSQGLEQLIVSPQTLGKASPSSFAAYTASAITKEFADVLDLASSCNSAPAR